MPPKRLEQLGFTYFGVVFLVMLIAMGLTGASIVWKIERQRQREQELLFVGKQYLDAIGSYYNSSPGAAKKYPPKVSDLLQDTRFLNIKRHLRRPWLDPMSNKGTWGYVYTNLGGIAGVYSLAPGKPIKQSGFLWGLEEKFAGQLNYQAWRFVYLPQMQNQTPLASQSSGDVVANTNDQSDGNEPEEFVP